MRSFSLHNSVIPSRSGPWILAVLGILVSATSCRGVDLLPHQDPLIVQKIKELGGHVYYDYQVASPEATIEEQWQIKDGSPPDPDRIAALGIDRVHRAEEVCLGTASRESLGLAAQLPYVKILWIYCPEAGGSPSRESRAVRDDDLAVLSQMPQLIELIMACSKVTAKGLGHLERLTHLRSLRLTSMDLSSPSELPLGHLKELRYLAMEGANVGNREVAFVSKLDNLKCAAFDESRITDDGLRLFLQLPKLESLSLPAGISRQGVVSLASIPTLCSLTLRGARIDDDCMTLLAAMKLKRLELIDTRLSDTGLRTLVGSKTLANLVITKSRITDNGILVLADLPTLKEIQIDLGHVALKRLGDRRPNLKGVKKSIGCAHGMGRSWMFYADDVMVSGEELDAMKKAGDKRIIGWYCYGDIRVPIHATEVQISGEVLDQLKGEHASF